jgi:hypothetical protein
VILESISTSKHSCSKNTFRSNVNKSVILNSNKMEEIETVKDSFSNRFWNFTVTHVVWNVQSYTNWKLINCGQTTLGNDSNEFKKKKSYRDNVIYFVSSFQTLTLLKRNIISSIWKSESFEVMTFIFHFLFPLCSFWFIYSI